MKKIIGLLLSAVLLLSVSCSRFGSPAEPFRMDGTAWTAGYGRVELVLEDSETTDFYMAGYKVGNVITGVLDYQYARAIWLDDGSGRGGIVLVAVDCIGLTSGDVNEIRQSLSDFTAETGCRSIHVFSTHTHAGIDTLGLWGPIAVNGKSEEFQQCVYDGVKRAVRDAYKNRRTGRLYTGSTEVEGMQQDSRLPEVYDKTLTVLRFEPDDGSAGIRLVNFAAHAESLRSENTLLSADYPAYMERKIESETGDRFLYITGAIGGLIMTPVLDDTVDNVENCKRTGEILADYALAITNERELPPSLNIATQSFDIPLDNRVYVTLKFLGVLSTEVVDGAGQYGLAVRTDVSYLELGDFKALFIPGELFPELAYGDDTETDRTTWDVSSSTASNPATSNPKTLAEILGQDDFIVFGLADDEIGYIVPPNDYLLHETLPYLDKTYDAYDRRHYEETNSVGIEAAGCLADAVSDLMQAINRQGAEG